MGKLHYWKLQISEPGGRGYNRTLTVGVVAYSVQEAIRLAVTDHPEATVYNVSHHGSVDIIGH